MKIFKKTFDPDFWNWKQLRPVQKYILLPLYAVGVVGLVLLLTIMLLLIAG